MATELDTTETEILEKTRVVLRVLSKLDLTKPSNAIEFTAPMFVLQQLIIEELKNRDNKHTVTQDDLLPELLNYFVKAGFRQKHLNEVDRLLKQLNKVSDNKTKEGRKTLHFRKRVPTNALVNLSFTEDRLHTKTKKPISALYMTEVGYSITNVLSSLEHLKPLSPLFEFKAALEQGSQSIQNKMVSSGHSKNLSSLLFNLQSLSNDIQTLILKEAESDLSKNDYHIEIINYHKQFNTIIAPHKLSGIDYILKRIELELRNILRATFNVKRDTTRLRDELHAAETADKIKTSLKPIK